MNIREPTPASYGEGRCSQCGQPLPEGHWFARIRRGGRTLDFCRPHCVESFLNASERHSDAFEDDYETNATVMASV